jgi:hypothetical protein
MTRRAVCRGALPPANLLLCHRIAMAMSRLLVEQHDLAPAAWLRLVLLGGLVAAAGVIGMHLAGSIPLQALIEHDDWSVILGDWETRKWLLNEGRPVVAVWSRASAHLISPEIAFAAYWLLFGVLGANLAVLCGCRRLLECVLAAFVVMFSSPVMSLAGWPATHFLGMGLLTLSCIAVSLVPVARQAWLWVFVCATIVLFQAYPPFAFVLLLHGLIAQTRAGRSPVGVSSGFILALAASVLLIFSVNHALFGHFGVIPQDWRFKPPSGDPSRLGRLGSDLTAAAKMYGVLLSNNLVTSIIALIGGAYALLTGKLRPSLLGALLAFPFGFDLLLAARTGAISPERTFLFMPFLVIILGSFLRAYPKVWLIVLMTGILMAAGHREVADRIRARSGCNELHDQVRLLLSRNDMAGVTLMVPFGYSAKAVQLGQRLRYDGIKVKYCDGLCMTMIREPRNAQGGDMARTLSISL